jgi:hypothetical protein
MAYAPNEPLRLTGPALRPSALPGEVRRPGNRTGAFGRNGELRMARWFLIAGAVGVLGVGVYFFATGESHVIGGGAAAAALLLAAAAAGVGRGSGKGAERQADPPAPADRPHD